MSFQWNQIFVGKLFCCLMLIVAAWLVVNQITSRPVIAEITSEHRRELSLLKREITKASSLIRRKESAEAEKILAATETKLKEIADAAGVTAEDPAIAAMQKSIDVQRQVLQKVMGAAEGKKPSTGVSFSTEIAPILSDNCLGCHDDDARGGLRLDTFANMKRGGSTGPLLIPGRAQQSLLALRLVANGPQRMPRGQPALAQAEINKIAEWINQGARFDGDNEATLLADLGKPAMKKPEIKINRPDGSETVSFKEDIAPMFVTFCLGCHSGNNPASGFSMETFENILIGGDSGEVLIPGKLEESRLFRLTGGLENPRMPQGQARITRKNYEDLKAWIQEGIKYDVEDPKMRLLDIVPTDAEKLAMELQAMSEADFQAYRLEQGATHWRRTLSSAKPVSITTEQFLGMGNVDVARLQEVISWAAADLTQLQQTYGMSAPPKWRGRLAIYVFKDRYDYDEFNRSIENRQPAETLFGHGKVTANDADAYVAVLDTGDVSSRDRPALQWTLFKALNSAVLQQKADTKPLWLIEGSGWNLAGKEIRGVDYEKTMISSAATVLRGLRRIEDLFENGTFAPDATEHVGYVTSRFLMQSGSAEQYRRFVKMILDGSNVNDACRQVYQATSANLAGSVLKALQ